MIQDEAKKYRGMLEAKQLELAAVLRKRQDITIEKASDAMDQVQLASERDLAVSNLDRESNLLRSVRGALARITAGSYGTCLHCEEEISFKRLNAVPWADFCILCQESFDRQELKTDHSAGIDDLLAA
jgi:DnaK suppressor protein